MTAVHPEILATVTENSEISPVIIKLATWELCDDNIA